MKDNKYRPKFFAKKPPPPGVEERLASTLAHLEAVKAHLASLQRENHNLSRMLTEERVENYKEATDASRYRTLRKLDCVFVLDGDAKNLKAEALDKFVDQYRFVSLFTFPPFVLAVHPKKENEDEN